MYNWEKTLPREPGRESVNEQKKNEIVRDPEEAVPSE